jgi:hypothetical protein
VVLVRRTRLFAAVGVPLLGAVLLTLAQVVTGSDTLAVLFPWRVSAVLVPVATVVILSRIVAVESLRLDGRNARGVALTSIAGLVAVGVWVMATRRGFHAGVEDVELMEFAHKHRAPGQLYFLPVHVPNLAATTRGGQSSDYKPLRDKKGDRRIIPVDLQRFRLHTGVPIYVDFKSIPYVDVDVIEWRDRIRVAERVHEWLDTGKVPEALAELRRLGTTHLVRYKKPELTGYGLKTVHKDSAYHVYLLPRD